MRESCHWSRGGSALSFGLTLRRENIQVWLLLVCTMVVFACAASGPTFNPLTTDSLVLVDNMEISMIAGPNNRYIIYHSSNESILM